MKRIAINGFGRIGRTVFKILLENKNVEVAAINDLMDVSTLAHLLRYDTAYGKYGKEISVEGDAIVIGGKTYPILAEGDPEKLPWKEMDVDTVLECTGRFVKDGAARAHVKAGARKVILSAPAKGSGDVGTVLLGVNDEEKGALDGDIISNASCTTNCIGPVVQVMHAAFGVEKALMTTIHSYTAQQNVQDGPNKDLRRARAAAQNIVPTTTGAAIATTKVIPELDGLFDGLAVRVPTITGSLSDLTFLLKQDVTVEGVNQALADAAQSDRYHGILSVTDEPIVSSDIIGDSHSSIVDLGLTKVVGGNLVKVVAWYDNEWGYSVRLAEMAERV